MRAPRWRRKRESGDARAQAAVIDGPAASMVDPPPLIGDTAFDPTPGSDPERAAEYEAWAQRMREKRERAKRTIQGETDEPASHWSADHVWRESERVAEQELADRPDPVVLTGTYGVLGLDATASAADVERAYRRLAKVHHPDFHQDADDETRAYHAEQMRQINEAYQTLKRLK